MGQATNLDHYIRESELRRLVPISHSTVWRMVASGAFPKPFKLGPRVTVWRWSEVEAWLDGRRSQPSRAGEAS